MRYLEDLKRRLAADRRCFAFFHPALPDEPLIFVQVALVEGLADKIAPLIDRDGPVGDPTEADTAIFYSISNCQEGLRGVSLGNFLIKLVVADLQAQLPDITTFATLSPVPGFGDWLRQEAAKEDSPVLSEAEFDALEATATPGWEAQPELAERARQPMLRLMAHYLVREKRGGRPRDPVARFHLGNGARLERVNWLGDTSEKGLREVLRDAGQLPLRPGHDRAQPRGLRQQRGGHLLVGGEGAAAGQGGGVTRAVDSRGPAA